MATLTEQEICVTRTTGHFTPLKLAYVACNQHCRSEREHTQRERQFRPNDVATVYERICSETEMDSLSNEQAQALLKKIDLSCLVFPLHGLDTNVRRSNSLKEHHAKNREPKYKAIIHTLLEHWPGRQKKPSAAQIEKWVDTYWNNTHHEKDPLGEGAIAKLVSDSLK